MRHYSHSGHGIVLFLFGCLKAATNLISLGINGRQWVTCLVICSLLALSMPISAFNSRDKVAMAPDSSGFEPVNEQLPFWTSAWRKINADLEARLNPLRPMNWSSSGKKMNRVSASDERKPVTTNSDDRAESHRNSLKGSDDRRVAVSVGAPEPPASAAPLVSEIPPNERESIFAYENNLGSPPGQVERDSPNPAAAARIEHRPGISNFNFDVPFGSIPGRGIDASIGMTYNSRIWNKSTVTGTLQNRFVYDVENSSLAPGFSTGYGYLTTRKISRQVDMGQGNWQWISEIVPESVVDPDGTRHYIPYAYYSTTACLQWVYIPGTINFHAYCALFRTVDGSNVRIKRRTGANYSWGLSADHPASSFTVVYPDGTEAEYSTPFEYPSTDIGKHYPQKITDRNGNFINITYTPESSGRIDHVTDTLERQIKFYYRYEGATPKELVAVTVPGLSQSSELQAIRFYYADITLPLDEIFPGAQVSAPSAPIKVLKYVYFPGTHGGFRYDYDPNYGMIEKITRLAGMSVSTTATNLTGEVSNDGQMAASTEYTWQAVTDDVPKYSTRLDDWAGNTGSATATVYAESEPDELGNTTSS